MLTDDGAAFVTLGLGLGCVVTARGTSGDGRGGLDAEGAAGASSKIEKAADDFAASGFAAGFGALGGSDEEEDDEEDDEEAAAVEEQKEPKAS